VPVLDATGEWICGVVPEPIAGLTTNYQATIDKITNMQIKYLLGNNWIISH